MSELFEVPEVLSPKLAWLKKHRLKVFDNSPKGWMCRNAGWTKNASGDTEDEAILDYCERHNLKHWTLESRAP